MDAPPESLPIGRFGRMQAIGLIGPDGDHAILVRQGPEQRALMTADQGDRLVFTPLDDDVDVRVDGDALAVWLASAPVSAAAPADVPAWASAFGLGLLVLMASFTVIGGAVAFSWLMELLGG
jgi:hypothetical protein